MRRLLAALLLSAVWTPIAALRAQDDNNPDGRLSLEVRGGVSRGEVSGQLASTRWRAGPAWRGGISYRLSDLASVYAGFGNNGFRCVRGFCPGESVRMASIGADAGMQFAYRRGWLRVGATARSLHAKWTAASGPERASGDLSVGWEIGAGVRFPTTARLSLAPGFRMGKHAGANPRVGGSDDVAYLAFDVGLELSLGHRSGARER